MLISYCNDYRIKNNIYFSSLPSVENIIVSKKENNKIYAGIDEAGRGPWAGPVVAAAIILHPDFPIGKLQDSKKLSSKNRIILYNAILHTCRFGVGEVSASEIDVLGIKKATEKAMHIAYEHLLLSQFSSSIHHELQGRPTLLLIDGNDAFTFPIAHKSIVRGDANIPAISAASIVAKVWRDKYMQLADEILPQYKFSRHKGYGTAMHRDMIHTYGISSLHRRTYKPIMQVIQLHQCKPTLLLHVCCGPDATASIQILQQRYMVTCYWYDPNIQPKSEYDKRLRAFKKVVKKTGVSFLVGNYDADIFIRKTSYMSDEPEGGKRCSLCFSLRLKESAKKAKQEGFQYFATTLTISPHKNVTLINTIGSKYGEKLGVTYIPTILRKDGGMELSRNLSKKWSIYRQNYCGCMYSIKNKSSK